MKCNNCNLCFKEDMAQIPYIEHRKRMYKAYKREKKLWICLLCSNAMWVFMAILSLVVR